ncbi:MAG: hypothetical protein JXB10_10790 [Pirellulales bacterium]|nr:hypothetical protein [Pirellulales bacterium]
MIQILLFGMCYGAAMGGFGGLSDGRIWQVVFSAVKVPLLLLAASLIALPSFFILNTLFGLRRDFAEALRALVATQAGLAVILASLSPLTLTWYASSADYAAALHFNSLMFAAASFGAQILLRGYYQPLIRRNRRHAVMLWSWLLIYVFVGIQMGWILRPFVGSPGTPVQFFREGAFSNAYEVVFQLMTGWLWK